MALEEEEYEDYEDIKDKFLKEVDHKYALL